jgi:hypothetical protein
MATVPRVATAGSSAAASRRSLVFQSGAIGDRCFPLNRRRGGAAALRPCLNVICRPQLIGMRSGPPRTSFARRRSVVADNWVYQSRISAAAARDVRERRELAERGGHEDRTREQRAIDVSKGRGCAPLGKKKLALRGHGATPSKFCQQVSTSAISRKHSVDTVPR